MANKNAKRDDNNVPTVIFVNEDGEIKRAVVDDFGRLLTTPDTPLERIRAGQAFTTSSFTESVTNGSNKDVLIKVGSNKVLEMYLRIAAGGQGRFSLYEGTTTTDDGTLLNTYDKNRTTDNTADHEVYEAPTIDSLGTAILEDSVVPGGSSGFGGANKPGSITDDPDPWRLKKDTVYLLRFNNASGGSISASIRTLCVELDN